MKKIFLGIIVGISVLIPGVCTASVAISLGIYEIIIAFFTLNRTKKTIKDLILICLGFIIGVIICAYLINSLDKTYQIKLMIFFYGFMLFGIKSFFNHKINDKFNLLQFIYGFVIIILFQLIFSYLKINFSRSLTALFIIGILVGMALVLPGLSGSIILISFGAYYPLIEIGTSWLKNICFSYSFFLLFSFCIGLFIGIIIILIVIKKSLNKKRNEFDNIVFGMMTGTIFIMTSSIFEYSTIKLFKLVILIFLGYIFNKLLTKYL